MPSQATLELLISLRDQASSGLSSLGGAMGNVGMIAGGAALAGVVALGAAIVGGAQDAQASRELLAQTEQTIKTTGGAAGLTAQQIVDMSSAMSDAAGKSPFGDDAIQRAENTLLTFTNIGKDVFPAATQATLDMAAALKTTPEAMDTLIGKALNTADGYKALKKSGVDFTEQQAAQIDAMFAAGNAAGAQTLILDELNKKYGGQAEAQAKAAGGLVQFKAGLAETFETIGGKLLPVLDKFGVWLNSPEVQQNISIFADKLGKGIEVAADFLVNDLIPAITDLYNFLAPILGPIIAEIARALSEDLPRGIDRVVTGWNTMKQAMSDFRVAYIDPIVRGWEAITGAISTAYTWVNNIAGAIGSIQVPAWLQGHSPPPMADWFDAIGLSAKSSGGALADFIAQMKSGNLPDMGLLFRGNGDEGGMASLLKGLKSITSSGGTVNQASVLDVLKNSLGGGNVGGDTLDRIAAMAFDQEQNAGGAGGALADMIHQLLLAQFQGNTGMVDQISAALNASVAQAPSPPAFGGGGGAGGGINVHVTVQGNVTTERNLALAIRDQLNDLGRRNISIFSADVIP